jgi:hypothetical protein
MEPTERGGAEVRDELRINVNLATNIGDFEEKREVGIVRKMSTDTRRVESGLLMNIRVM